MPDYATARVRKVYPRPVARLGGDRYTRETMLMEVTCRCGWTTRGSKAQVIENIQAHGRSEHGLEVTPDEVRAVWRVVNDEPAGDRSAGMRP